MKANEKVHVANHLKQVIGAAVATTSWHGGDSKKVKWKRRRRQKNGGAGLSYGFGGRDPGSSGNLVEQAASHLVATAARPSFGCLMAGYTCTQIFRVENDALRHRFNATAGKVGNVRELWHGTRITSALQIVREGLRVGYGGMFGGGIYTGPFGKAVSYGDSNANVRFLLKVRVALGRVWYATAPEHRVTGSVLWQNGFHSIAGMRKVTKSFAGTLREDEYVVYDPAQVLVTEIWEFRRV